MDEQQVRGYLKWVGLEPEKAEVTDAQQCSVGVSSDLSAAALSALRTMAASPGKSFTADQLGVGTTTMNRLPLRAPWRLPSAVS